MKTIIAGNSIIKTYGESKEKTKVLDGVNIQIAEGEFVAIMGPSGCGKSSLLFALSATDNIDEGSITFSGKELSKLKENQLADIRRTKMGFVFQQPTMLKNLNIMDNIILPAVQENKDTNKINQKAKALMKQAGISDLAKRDTTEVSGGQLQRAGICRALVGEPEIIFADEPTGALNSKSTEEIMILLSDINKNGTAIMLVTHDAKVAAKAERVLFMKDGRIVSEVQLGKYDENNFEDRTEKISSVMANVGI